MKRGGGEGGSFSGFGEGDLSILSGYLIDSVDFVWMMWKELLVLFGFVWFCFVLFRLFFRLICFSLFEWGFGGLVVYTWIHLLCMSEFTYSVYG